MIFADTGSFSVESGDQLILCTDGLSGKLSKTTICDLLTNDLDSTKGAETLVRAALNYGTRDNVTAIVVKILENC